MEVLLTVLIVGVLIAVLFPVIASVRRDAQAHVSVGRTRNIITLFEAYVVDYKAYPFTDGATPHLIDSNYQVVISPWNLDSGWPYLLASVAPWSEHFAAWISPGARRGPQPWLPEVLGSGPDGTSYQFCLPFITTPANWDPDASIQDARVTATRPDMVRFPSQKAIIFDAERAYWPAGSRMGGPRPIGFADSSVAILDDGLALPGTPNRLFGNAPPTRLLQHTFKGIIGVDYLSR